MRKKKLGMTLVEVLIGIIIGTVRAAAVFYAYNIFNKSYQGVVEKASISKSGRDALSQLARELRNVGYKDINQVKGPLEEYLWKENNVSGFQVGSDSLMIFYDLSAKERVRIDYKLKKYQNSQDTFLSRSFFHWTCSSANNCPVKIDRDQVFVNNVGRKNLTLLLLTEQVKSMEENTKFLVIDRTLFLPNRTEPNLFFAELCSAEPNGSAKVRPIWPNPFGLIGRTCSAVLAEHVRPYLPIL